MNEYDFEAEEEFEIDASIERLVKRTIKQSLRSFARDVAKATVSQIDEAHEPYSFGYSVLTVRFAEGSEPQAISIPYLPGRNRADIRLPLKVVSEAIA